ncbi:hypothetical protein ACFQXA_04920 [Nocardiopsis composta]
MAQKPSCGWEPMASTASPTPVTCSVCTVRPGSKTASTPKSPASVAATTSFCTSP